MRVTKLLIFPVEISIFCPKTTKFGPKLAILVNLGQAMQAYAVPCWWVGLWLWRAGCISQDTYLLYVDSAKHFSEPAELFTFPTGSADTTCQCTKTLYTEKSALYKECMMYSVFQHRLLTRLAAVHCNGPVHKLLQALLYKEGGTQGIKNWYTKCCFPIMISVAGVQCQSSSYYQLAATSERNVVSC